MSGVDVSMEYSNMGKGCVTKNLFMQFMGSPFVSAGNSFALET